MCFFKQLATPPAVPSDYLPPSKNIHEDTSADIGPDCDSQCLPERAGELLHAGKCQSILMNCLGMISLNSQMMGVMDEKLSRAQNLLDEGKKMLEEAQPCLQSTPKRVSTFPSKTPEKDEQNLFETTDKLTHRLFGSCSYKYKLALDGSFPDILYKERNFSLSLRLVDAADGKEKLNGNIVNVCLGLCDDNGDWIHETKEGQAFLKGKIEAELYHGSASFVKMAARDVSRNFVNKTVNLVVYPKPTVLRYSGESSIEERIDYSLIEPLTIHNICIKAKKRE